MFSMTGFGRAEARGGNVAVTVELKSVNNRFRDINLRCPREYAALEPKISGLLKARFARGRIEVYVRRLSDKGATEIQFSTTAAQEALLALRGLAQEVEGVDDTISLSFLAGLPGVMIQGDRETDSTSEWSLVEMAVLGAIEHLSAMRSAEGDALERDLAGNLEQIKTLQSEVLQFSEGISNRLELRLMERLNRLVGDGVGEARLAQEAAIQADKADVAEELTRLSSHFEQFGIALAQPGPCGPAS
jgi:uncharacterized protein (TIGR00255 family)